MTNLLLDRRTLLAAGVAWVAVLIVPAVSAHAQVLAATPSMRGGSNNYMPNAPIVETICGGGFMMTGTVRRGCDGAPLDWHRIQFWSQTTVGHERDPHSHGVTL